MSEDKLRITDPHKLNELYQFFMKRVDARLDRYNLFDLTGKQSSRVVGITLKDGEYKCSVSLVKLTYENKNFCLITSVVCHQFTIIFDIGFIADIFEFTGASIIARGDGEDFIKFMLEMNDIK